MRIIVIPDKENNYDKRMVQGLSDGFNVLGYDSSFFYRPLGSIELYKFCQNYSIDIVIQINKTWPVDTIRPNHVRHVTWIQDVFLDNKHSFINENDQDLTYTLGTKESLGLNFAIKSYRGVLATGVCDYVLTKFHSPSIEQYDFSLCGFIPPIKIASHWKKLRNYIRHKLRPKNQKAIFSQLEEIIRTTVEKNYSPLSGNLDINKLHDQILTHIFTKNYFKTKEDPLYSEYFIKKISYYTQTYPRFLDRFSLVSRLSNVTKNFALYGSGWDSFEPFIPYYKGFLEEIEPLIDVYKASKLNVYNNTHGVGLHSRTLECFGSGSFVFSHLSNNEERDDALSKYFEPNVDFAVYNYENLERVASDWIKNDQRRLYARNSAYKKILNGHRWVHRAKQIIDDLKR